MGNFTEWALGCRDSGLTLTAFHTAPYCLLSTLIGLALSFKFQSRVTGSILVRMLRQGLRQDHLKHLFFWLKRRQGFKIYVKNVILFPPADLVKDSDQDEGEKPLRKKLSFWLPAIKRCLIEQLMKTASRSVSDRNDLGVTIQKASRCSEETVTVKLRGPPMIIGGSWWLVVPIRLEVIFDNIRHSAPELTVVKDQVKLIVFLRSWSLYTPSVPKCVSTPKKMGPRVEEHPKNIITKPVVKRYYFPRPSSRFALSISLRNRTTWSGEKRVRSRNNIHNHTGKCDVDEEKTDRPIWRKSLAIKES